MEKVHAVFIYEGAKRDGYWPPPAPSVNATEQKSQNPPEPKFRFFLILRARLGAPFGRPKSSPESSKNRIQPPRDRVTFWQLCINEKSAKKISRRLTPAQ